MVESNTTKSNMIYRFLGNTGIQVSVLGWGNWITGKDEKENLKTIKAALDAGINYFDTAEIYDFGKAETSIGNALKELNVRRESIVVSTKMFKIGFGVNDSMLSRKHIIEGLQNSLKRLQLDYVDIVFCHRYDELTPIEEVCRAMNYCIEKGMAFYWATSEWRASQIMEAYAVCDKLGLIRPVADQCQYNMIIRTKMEDEYTHLFDKYNMGTTTWSPLFSGVLTGKYKEKVDEGTRFDTSKNESRYHMMQYTTKKEEWDKKISELSELAKSLGDYSMPQLALAWVIRNPNVSTCLMGTSKVEQLLENIKALELMKKLDKDVEEKIEKILGNAPDAGIFWRDFSMKEPRRKTLIGKF